MSSDHLGVVDHLPESVRADILWMRHQMNIGSDGFSGRRYQRKIIGQSFFAGSVSMAIRNSVARSYVKTKGLRARNACAFLCIPDLEVGV